VPAPILLTADLIEAFAGTFLSTRYDEPKPTPAFHREAWELYASAHPQVGCVAPRDHAKSTGLTFDYILAEVLFRASDYVILIGSTEEKAAEQLSNIRDELHINEDLRQEFGVQEFEVDGKTEIVVVMKDDHRFRILARGGEQKIRGSMWKGKRPNLIVCHALGTPIFDRDLGAWMPVEAHPTAKLMEADRLLLKVGDNEYNEVVSTDHFYLARESLSTPAIWMQARDIRVGYLIGDCDEEEIGRLLPRNAGTLSGAISPRETAGVQRRLSSEEQRENLGEGKDLGPAESGEHSALKRKVEKEQSGKASFVGQGIVPSKLSCASRELHQECQAAFGAAKASHSEVGQQAQDVLDGTACEVLGVIAGSHRADQLADRLRPALRGQSANHHLAGEHSEVQHYMAGHAVDGFVWRPVTAVHSVGKGIVVAIRTKSGFYKTKFGMSHNCDDM